MDRSSSSSFVDAHLKNLNINWDINLEGVGEEEDRSRAGDSNK
tara:strand:+ start:368 stop:496 length:129 start_codon:yes stop_codon:yes gene_type:complete